MFITKSRLLLNVYLPDIRLTTKYVNDTFLSMLLFPLQQTIAFKCLYLYKI